MSTGHESGFAPLIAITLGDPAGIGPEIIVKAWDILLSLNARFVVIGRGSYLRRAAQTLGCDIDVVEVSDTDSVLSCAPGQLPCLTVGSSSLDGIPPGMAGSGGGQLAYESIINATDLAIEGRIDGIVTAPISKLALQQAGHEFPGHTELLAHRCGVQNFAMMLYMPPQGDGTSKIGLGVVHATLHQSLRSAIDQLTTDRIFQVTKLANEFGQAIVAKQDVQRKVKIAVAALNPHAGEQGMFGREEIDIIEPAVQKARERGFDCSGPLPCDSVMARALAGEFDMVVAMYHDQGHIALKLSGLSNVVNVTLGLPVIRTSVAHGTAFDLAGTGRASTGSLLSAVAVAQRLIEQRNGVAAS